MGYFIHIKENNIVGKGQCIGLSNETTSIEVTKEIYDNFDKYIYQDEELVENPEYSKIELQRAKEVKISENDNLRDEKLNSGVMYSNVLFDSDTDQKINLLATYPRMTDEDTIVWYGKDNQGLLCTKSDLFSIGELITEMHSYCWQMNAYVKEQIEQAETLEELENIVISY